MQKKRFFVTLNLLSCGYFFTCLYDSFTTLALVNRRENYMESKSILIVDDEPLTLRIATFVLKEAEYNVSQANSGEECLKMLSAQNFDLVLLDIEMPEMNGFETLEKIRESKPGQKVSFLTASDFSKYSAEAKKFGIENFISKPIFPAELQERVAQVLDSDEKPKVLVVDDEPMMRLQAKRILQSDYTVEVAESLPNAMEILKFYRPSLIFLDIYMPEMDGFEALQKLREIDFLKDIPVIFLTAAEDSETESRVFKVGASDFIKKPYVRDVILERTKRILSLSNLQKSLKKEVDKRTSELLESQRRLKILSLQMVKTLASAIDAKDAYTNGHSVRVAKYSRELASNMGKPIEEIEKIYIVALLHDIGKIGIPDTIINKTSKLTDEEYEIIKKHPSIGADILKNVPEMPNIAVGAHWHHERYDGKGYPDGLKGPEIPEIARIIAVADAYDAMTSRRSYRNSLPQEVVRSEIEKGRGFQFDPDIADIMLRLIDEDVNYEMRDKVD